MASDDTKSDLSGHTKNNDDVKDKKSAIATDNTVSDIPTQNVNSSNNNSIKDASSSLVGNNANKGSHPSNDKPPNVPKESLVIDDIDKKNSLLKEINRIDNWANVAADNGLFDTKQNNDKNIFEEIQGRLKDARKMLYANELPEADYEASKALRLYDKALYSVSRKWRFANVYGGPMWFYLIGFLVAVLVFYWFHEDVQVFSLNVKIQQDALYAATWGTVGGILRGLWFLKDRVTDRKYRNSFRLYFLSVPFIGGLFGAFLYFILLTGFLILTPSHSPAALTGTNNVSNSTAPVISTQTNSPESTATNPAIIPLAILAGFNWEFALVIFKRIGDSFKSTSEADTKIGK
jgi:hypothetical protein